MLAQSHLTGAQTGFAYGQSTGQLQHATVLMIGFL